jgi:hypothetical protein
MEIKDGLGRRQNRLVGPDLLTLYILSLTNCGSLAAERWGLGPFARKPTLGHRAGPNRTRDHPTWILEMEWKSPNTFRSHKTTTMTTTAFRIDLMELAMGTKRFTSQSRTPTTTRTIIS